jgi:hypothetical protein
MREISPFQPTKKPLSKSVHLGESPLVTNQWFRRKLISVCRRWESYLFGDFAASGLGEGEAACDDVGDGAGVTDAEGEGCGDDDDPAPDRSTERDPVIAGCESINAISMKATAAPIVILARMLAVPRGPNAVLETLLLNIAPASDLPGCKSTTTTSTTQARIKKPYKR